ncbi:interaptin-like [Tachysurus vachellii]|uniref:interaptin-like n=1 Tax=Tachysurus vachellii TaxID=175792 RepID=UPI00296ADA59|nr:interaptin-like [Tachysurus vachellii]
MVFLFPSFVLHIITGGASALRTKSNLKFKLILSGKTLNSHKDFITRLNQQVHLKEVNTEDECDFILGFCTIVTRAGTDIEAAMKRLHDISDTKPVVLVVLHHTFDPERVVPDSIRCVNRKNMIAVDCLFYEDKGLLQCLKNNESLDKTSQYLKEYINCENMKRQKEGERSETVINKDKELETSTNKLDTLGQELQDQQRQLQDMMTVVEQQKSELAEKNQQLEEKDRLLTERETQLMGRDKDLQEKDRLLTENTQTLQKKDKTLEEKEKQLIEVREELRKSNMTLEKNQTQLKDKERQLESVVKELETSTNKLTERDKQLQEKDKQLKQTRAELDKTFKELEDSQRHVEEKNTQLENLNKLLKEKETQLKNTDKELETSTNKLDTLGQELQDKQRQLQDMMIVVEQQKSELAEKKQQLKEKVSLLTERETQLMERDKELQEKDRLLTETRQLEMKDETLEQKGTHFFQLKKKVKCYEVIPPKVQAPCEQFTKELKKIRKSMKMSTEEECKAILYYVPIVSRAGTDIEAALQKLNSFGDKYIALVVLHHTFDRELITPDSSRTVTREKTFIVDCLFSEDEGLFSCRKNDEAIKKVAEWLKFVKHDKQDPKKKKVKPVRKMKQ